MRSPLVPGRNSKNLNIIGQIREGLKYSYSLSGRKGIEGRGSLLLQNMYSLGRKAIAALSLKEVVEKVETSIYKWPAICNCKEDGRWTRNSDFLQCLLKFKSRIPYGLIASNILRFIYRKQCFKSPKEQQFPMSSALSVCWFWSTQMAAGPPYVHQDWDEWYYSGLFLIVLREHLSKHFHILWRTKEDISTIHTNKCIDPIFSQWWPMQ